jgi:16S rRNA (cytosine967-C5)-methyltransferase
MPRRPAKTATKAADPADSRAPRRAALALLGLVTDDHRLLSDPACASVLERLPPEIRARARRLATETLRQAGRADHWLAPLLLRRPPAALRDALRLGAVEIGQGGAPYGVVNDIVALLAADPRTRHLVGAANAILRRIGDQGPAAFAALPPPQLPRWLRDPLCSAWGASTVGAIEAVQATAPPLDLTARADPESLAQQIGATLLPTLSLRLPGTTAVTALPGFAEGLFWVQDAAAALPARLLAPQPGEKVLDLCAAPGGKTLQLAAGGAAVTALDISAARAARIAENLARTGLAARIVVADALTFNQAGWDALLLDAPCSATGTIRRHPDLPHARDGHEIPGLVKLQARMIDHALTLLAPGGRLVFSTCSLLPEEGEAQTRAALARNPGLAVEPLPSLPGLDPAWASPEGGLRLRPDHWADRGGIDGFYMVLLRKPA